MSIESARPTDSRILVLGNLAFETALIPDQSLGTDSFRKVGGWVGAVIIREMISQALEPNENDPPGASGRLSIHPMDLLLDNVKANCEELTTIFGQFPKRSDRKKSGTVWRVKTNYRAWPEAANKRMYDSYLEKCIRDCSNPDIVVIYEQDPNFRDALVKLAKAPEKEQLRTGDRLIVPTLIVALADDVNKTSIEAAKRIFGKATTIILLTADGLRRRGLNIAAYGSIEQTIQDLAAYRSTSPLKELLDDCSHLIVLFEETGAVCISNTDREPGSIHFCPNFDRVAQMDKETFGRVPGRMAIALTAVTRAVYEQRASTVAQPLDLGPSLRLAVLAYNKMFDTGFESNDPFQTAKAALSPGARDKLKGLLNPKEPTPEFLVSSLLFPTDPIKLKEWSRLDNMSDPNVALKIVRNGVEAACRDYSAGSDGGQRVWWPGSQITCPFMQVGRLQTFDRDEIERLADLAKLMRKYSDDVSWSTPLSIAVFGPPGAGKSFTVKELMKAINPSIKESSILTFNLAQFDSLELLTEAFHQVQDQALSADDVPLVIFDEFDSNFQGSPLGWLKYFLAPMEDGVFRGRSANYKVGRAVFLLAGGTADSFDSFTKDDANPESQSEAAPKRLPEQRTKQIDQKAVKLPDFASRLMAHLDVLGINPPSKKSEEVESASRVARRRVRRATLLRSLLASFAAPIIAPDGEANVAADVVTAFLNDRVFYKNEARSMKALVRGSRWIGKQFLMASLPSRRLIELHTDNWFGGPSSATSLNSNP